MKAPRKRTKPAVPPIRPLHDLLYALPLLNVDAGQFDLNQLTPAQLAQIGESAQRSAQVANKAIAALGEMLVLAAADAETGDVAGANFEACGWLLRELADLQAVCGYLHVTASRMLAEQNIEESNPSAAQSIRRPLGQKLERES